MAEKGDVLVFDSNARTITFEFDKVLPNGFVAAKKWCNSIALTNGTFPEYIFNAESIRRATDAEREDWEQLKAHSQYQFNIE